MRTGRFSFTCVQPPRGLRFWRRPAPLQVLLVEVDEPIDEHGNRATQWRKASMGDSLRVMKAAGGCFDTD